MAKLIQTGLIGLIRVYQLLISGFLGHRCRFIPSCSTYTQESIRIHGSLKGSFIGLKRIVRCHPWCPGGIDPVPLLPTQAVPPLNKRN